MMEHESHGPFWPFGTGSSVPDAKLLTNGHDDNANDDDSNDVSTLQYNCVVRQQSQLKFLVAEDERAVRSRVS